MNSSNPESLALAHNDDSFVLELEQDGKSIRLLRILRFLNNENVNPDSPRFFDLDDQTRAAILRQIQRRHSGSVVKIQ